MNIVVCIKQVPNTNNVKLDPVTGTLKREGIPSIINPDDKRALEAALKLKDEYGAHVTVMTMGLPQADLALKEAVAMGADEAILITDRAFAGSDTWATSSVLAAAVKKLPFDIIFTGRQAIDGDTAQVGPQIAEHLGLPSVSYAEEIKLEEDAVTVKRKFEDRYHLIRVKTPCLITALSELNTPRYMTPGRIFDAFNAPELATKIWSNSDLGMDPETVGLKGSPTKVLKAFDKAVKPAGQKYKPESPEAAAALIVEKLQEKFIL